MFINAIGMLVVAFVLAALGTEIWLLVTSLFIFFVGFNFLEASLPAHVSRLAPAGQKGSAMGIYSSSQFIGAFLGGISGGYIAQTFGFSYLFAANTILAVLWLVISLGMVIPKSSKRVSVALEPNTVHEYERLIEAVSQCEGVMEATFVQDEYRIYLKVEKHHYDKDKVGQLISEFS